MKEAIRWYKEAVPHFPVVQLYGVRYRITSQQLWKSYNSKNGVKVLSPFQRDLDNAWQDRSMVLKLVSILFNSQGT